MFNALLSYISGGSRIKVRGLNLDRLIALLLKEGFTLRNLTRQSYQVLVFDVPKRKKKKVIEFLAKQNYAAETEKEYGLPAALQKLSLRVGLIIGFLLLIGGIAVYNSFVWDITVQGNERIPDAEVAALLGNMGVNGGMKKSGVDRNKIALELNTKLNDASDVTVQLKGNNLIINIIETIKKDGEAEPEIPYSIKASYDAVIVKVLVIDGTAMVKPGDVVKKGAVLIAGYNLDTEGNMTETRAKGEVTGKVFFTADNVFMTEREEYVRTGNFTESRSLKLFGMNIRLKKAAEPYPLYEKESENSALITNMFLPFKKSAERYYELELKTNQYDYETEKDAIISRVKAEAEAQLPAGIAVKAAKTDIRQIDKYVITMYNIEVIMDI